MAKSKTSAKSAEPQTAKTPEPEAKQAPVKDTKAVFVPVGHVNVHLETPSGNEYNLTPREVFTIAAGDVDWFFNEWDWGFRQRLVLAKEYKPMCGYHDSKAGEKDYQPTMEYSDPKAGEKDYQPTMAYEPEPTEPARPSDAPAVAVAAAETEVSTKEHGDA